MLQYNNKQETEVILILYRCTLSNWCLRIKGQLQNTYVSKEIFPHRIIQTPNKVGLFNPEDTTKGAYLGTENGGCLLMDFLTALAIFPSEAALLTLKIVLHTRQVFLCVLT